MDCVLFNLKEVIFTSLSLADNWYSKDLISSTSTSLDVLPDNYKRQKERFQRKKQQIESTNEVTVSKAQLCFGTLQQN